MSNGMSRDSLQTFLHDATLSTQRGADYHPSLVVEVAQDDLHAVANLAQRVRDRDAHIVESYICSTSRGGVGSLDGFCFDFVRAWHKDYNISFL